MSPRYFLAKGSAFFKSDHLVGKSLTITDGNTINVLSPPQNYKRYEYKHPPFFSIRQHPEVTPREHQNTLLRTNDINRQTCGNGTIYAYKNSIKVHKIP